MLLVPLKAHPGLPGIYLATSPLNAPQRLCLDSMDGPTCPRFWHEGVKQDDRGSTTIRGSEGTRAPRLGQALRQGSWPTLQRRHHGLGEVEEPAQAHTAGCKPRGNGVLLEGELVDVSRHSISDAHGRKERYYVLYIRPSRIHRRKFDPKGNEIEPNFSATRKRWMPRGTLTD